MALVDGQVQVRDLIMGDGTPYEIIDFDPWTQTTRTNQQPRTWNHGDWAGAEWLEANTITMHICLDGKPVNEVECQLGDFDTWITNRHALAAAFAPIGSSTEAVALSFRYGSQEYTVFGRPRVVDPDSEWLSWVRPGGVITTCAFVALDPRLYSAIEHVGCVGLSSSSGGLTVPFTVPFFIGASVTTGQATLVNAGTTMTGVVFRVNGPVVNPRLTLSTPSGPHSLIFDLTLSVNQWLDVNTATRTVYLNGTVSRRGQTSVIGDWPLLHPGAWELAFDAAAFDPDALLCWSYRDAWM